jgi:hypothetical protein
MRPSIFLLIPGLFLITTAAARAQNCAQTSVGLVPIDDLATGTYQGQIGGLYPNGSNVRPEHHTIDGLAQAGQILPRDASGSPAANGKVVFLSIGMSNATQEFSRFVTLANADALKNPNVMLVDGAQGGQTALILTDPNAHFWTVVEQRLQSFGVTDAQVQAIWFKEADASPTNGWPAYAQTLRTEFETVMNILRTKFPNARVCFVASRIYAGYATSQLNPEPYSYEQGFSCKWMIEDQINGAANLNFDPSRGPVVAPWVDWGSYNWADGLTPRSDGLTWECSDFQNDGTHPSSQGEDKVAHILLDFVHSEPTAGWYLARPAPAPFGTGKTTSIGTQPVATWTGSPSQATGDFHVRITDALPHGVGIVFAGPTPASVPFVNATRYVGLPITRLGLHMFDASGASEWSIPVLGSMIGRTTCYQAYVRDAAQPDGTGAGLSSGLRVVFWP